MEGYDACRKIAILSSLISGQQVDFEDIYCEGITEITVEDIGDRQKLRTVLRNQRLVGGCHTLACLKAPLYKRVGRLDPSHYRTSLENSNVTAVLDGNIDMFINAYLKGQINS